MVETIAKYVFWWVVYSFFGWCIEVIRNYSLTKKFVNAGFVFGPFCTIYGVGALAVIILLRPLHDNPLAVFVLAAIIASVIEFIGHWILEKFFSLTLWDYSDRFMNLQGRICLFNSMMFGLLSLAAIYIVQPGLEKLTAWLPVWLVVGVAALAALWFIFDVLNSSIAAVKRGSILSNAENYRRKKMGRLHHGLAKRFGRLDITVKRHARRSRNKQ